ncbi:hypothetical protein [Chitinophaga vietnamensis]|uniref:hypothetical protein n=1 Tax=Chitinophaga vietnamensis TaxID=2593957 RepID=UPI00117847C5|nr:hypothetical protein [Chitinophaga vietnamensis]
MSGLQIKYDPLLQVGIQQLYYKNNVCPKYTVTPELDILCTPTSECIALMNKLDMVFRPSGISGGFAVLARVSGKNGGGSDLLRFAPGAFAKLSFWMFASNPELLNFNDLPLQPASNQLYYFSNGVTDNAAPRNNLHITVDSGGVKGSNDLVNYSGASYSFRNSAPVVPGTTKVKHRLTGAELQPTAILNDLTFGDVKYNLLPLPSGICDLYIGGIVKDTFYYAVGLPSQPVLGVIELSLSSLLPANYRVVEPDRSLNAPAPQYMISFNRRKTRWRYTFSMTANSPLALEMAALSPASKTDFLSKLNVVSNDTGITFKQGLVSDTAIEFISVNPFDLQEVYVSASSPTHDQLGLSLKKYIGDPKEAVVRADLPYPSTSTVNNLQAPFIYSDIFLTL